jgi:ribulose-phosphate 3-epimerase
MAVICPTVTTTNNKDYRESIERICEFAERIHIDFADGMFAPVKMVSIEDAWWPVGPVIDFHIMYKNPLAEIEEIIVHQPHLVVIHAEADSAAEFIDELEDMGIKRGVALLKDTPVSAIKDLLPKLDHVLIFSGDLGHYGGTVDLSLLDKVKELKALKPDIEIGWDGGINDKNARDLAKGGVDVLNVGGFIQKSPDPENAYDTLKTVIG